MPSYALSNKYKPLLPPPPSAHGGGEGTESTEGVGSQEPPSASNAVGGATDYCIIINELNGKASQPVFQCWADKCLLHSVSPPQQSFLF